MENSNHPKDNFLEELVFKYTLKNEGELRKLENRKSEIEEKILEPNISSEKRVDLEQELKLIEQLFMIMKGSSKALEKEIDELRTRRSVANTMDEKRDNIFQRLDEKSKSQEQGLHNDKV